MNETGRAERGGTTTTGQGVTPPTTRERVQEAPRPRIPIGDEELRRLKEVPGSPKPKKGTVQPR
jgi:hypothetical protein